MVMANPGGGSTNGTVAFPPGVRFGPLAIELEQTQIGGQRNDDDDNNGGDGDYDERSRT